jgi:hypothetical protein
MTTSFRDGYKYVDGTAIPSLGTQEFLSSNGVTKYTAVAWADGTTSCNCTGWSTSKKTPRQCKHSRQVQPGVDIRLDLPVDHETVYGAGKSSVVSTKRQRVEVEKKGKRRIVL